MPIAPEYQAMLEQMAATPGPAMTDLPPTEARGLYRMMRPAAPELTVGSVEEGHCSAADGHQIPLRIYRPEEPGAAGVLVFFHGGGWVIGDLETADAACRLLCREVGCVVVSVDYRLAPEHPYPAAVDDCWDATRWCAAQREQLGGNGRLAVAGESAGGTLATVIAQRAAAAGGPELALQLLAYPVTDCDFSYPSYAENGEGRMLETATMRWFWDHYCPDPARRQEPDAAPLRGQLSGLAPALVVTAEFDPLRDEGAAYAQQLEAAGTQVTYHCAPGLLHDFFATAALFESVKPSFQLACDSLRAALRA